MNRTETKSTALLKHHLKGLKLPTILAECEKIGPLGVFKARSPGIDRGFRLSGRYNWP